MAVEKKVVALSRIGGPLNISDSLRRVIVVAEDGVCWVAQSHKNDPEVQSFLKQREKSGTVYVTKFVTQSDITQIYDDNRDHRDSSDEESSQQGRVKQMIRVAATLGASDIHLVLSNRVVSAIFRIDGVMERQPDFETEEAYGGSLARAAFNTMTNTGQTGTSWNPTENQDGRIAKRKWLPDAVASIRVASGPIAGGWEIVLRLSYQDRKPSSDLASLGYEEKQIWIFRRVSRLPHGLNIICGPTGSGKSTTLARIMTGHHLDSNGQKNTVTVEEPVELPILGARQHSVASATESEEDRRRAFNDIGRSVLRRDPDIIMFGEVRDFETAAMAFKGAMTGHLVWTTTHANGAFDIPSRMVEIGVDPSLVYDHSLVPSLTSQTLLRLLCQHCKVPAVTVTRLSALFARDATTRPVTADERAADLVLKRYEGSEIARVLTTCHVDKTFFLGAGCDHCKQRGTTGRRLVAEVVKTDGRMMNDLRSGKKGTAIARWIREGGRTKKMIAVARIEEGLHDPFEAESMVGEIAVIMENGVPQPLDQVLRYDYDI